MRSEGGGRVVTEKRSSYFSSLSPHSNPDQRKEIPMSRPNYLGEPEYPVYSLVLSISSVTEKASSLEKMLKSLLASTFPDYDIQITEQRITNRKTGLKFLVTVSYSIEVYPPKK
jgi:hypothetical protein